MYFISLTKFKKKPTKAFNAETQKMREAESKEGIKFLGIYWTLGKYDSVALYEAPNEQAVMKMALRRAEMMDMETLVAVPLEEAKKLVD